MKRLIALFMAILTVFLLVACGNQKQNEEVKIDCPSCGEGISKDVAFCEHCGAAVKDNQGGASTNDAAVDNSTVTGDKTTETPATTTAPAPTTTTPPATTAAPRPAAHSHSYSHVVTAPTCTAQGYTTHTCSCGDTYKDAYTNPAHT